MSAVGPALISTASLVAGVLFAHVAYHVAKRRYLGRVRSIAIAFAVAWGGLAFMAINDGLRILVGSYAPDAFAWYSALAMLKIVANGAVIWSLGTYVIYLWLGPTRTASWSLAAFSAAHVAFFLYAYVAYGPTGLTSGAWVPRPVYQEPTGFPLPLGTFAVVLFFLPPVSLILAYGALAWRLREPTLRFRIGATALAIATFQIANLLRSHPALPGDSFLFPVLAVVTLLSGLIAHATYYPPAWMSRRTHLDGARPATAPPSARRSTWARPRSDDHKR